MRKLKRKNRQKKRYKGRQLTASSFTLGDTLIIGFTPIILIMIALIVTIMMNSSKSIVPVISFNLPPISYNAIGSIAKFFYGVRSILLILIHRIVDLLGVAVAGATQGMITVAGFSSHAISSLIQFIGDLVGRLISVCFSIIEAVIKIILGAVITIFDKIAGVFNAAINVIGLPFRVMGNIIYKLRPFLHILALSIERSAAEFNTGLGDLLRLVSAAKKALS